jgi:hypothetical protein
MVTNDYMYSIGGVAGARNPNNAECFIAQPATLYENGFSLMARTKPAQPTICSANRQPFPLRTAWRVNGLLRTRALQPHSGFGGRDSPANTYHVPLNAGSEKQFSNDDMSGLPAVTVRRLRAAPNFRTRFISKAPTTRHCT